MKGFMCVLLVGVLTVSLAHGCPPQPTPVLPIDPNPVILPEARLMAPLPNFGLQYSAPLQQSLPTYSTVMTPQVRMVPQTTTVMVPETYMATQTVMHQPMTYAAMAPLQVQTVGLFGARGGCGGTTVVRTRQARQPRQRRSVVIQKSVTSF